MRNFHYLVAVVVANFTTAIIISYTLEAIAVKAKKYV